MTRNEQIVARINGGATAAELARELGLSRERVRQVYVRATCKGIPHFRPTKPCAHCCRAFNPHNVSVQYCSRECYADAKRRWHFKLAACAECGDIFTLTPRQQVSRAQNIQHGYIKFIDAEAFHCSPSCAVKHGRRLERKAKVAA